MAKKINFWPSDKLFRGDVVVTKVREAMEAGDGRREMLALRWFLLLPQLLMRTQPRSAPPVPNYLKRRFRLFETGRYGTLLREWAADAVLTAAEVPHVGAQSPATHAVRLLSKGLMSRAAQHLSSSGSADPADPAQMFPGWPLVLGPDGRPLSD